MATSLKILVCGDVQGNVDAVYNRVTKLKNKGSIFDMLLCVGDFFGDGENKLLNWLLYRNGTKQAPIATYVLGANQQSHLVNYEMDSPDGFEFCENITFLGRKGVFTGASGVRIAYLSGCESPAGSGPSPKYCFTQDDVNALSESLNVNSNDYNGVDILLTSPWPKGVSAFGNAPSASRCKDCGSAMLSKLTRLVKPRYHFAGLEGVHYERLPYRNHTVLAESAQHVTRFIALAPVGNKEKQKYLYAFTITPKRHMLSSDLNQQPSDATECPFKEKPDEKSAGNNGSADQYRWNMSYKPNAGKKRRSSNEFSGPEKKQARPQDWSCWFCLGGDKVEKHLVASVGELVCFDVEITLTCVDAHMGAEVWYAGKDGLPWVFLRRLAFPGLGMQNMCYVAMAKGGLTPDHVLILPIAHHSSSLDLPDDTYKEAEKFKQALMDAFYSEGRPCVIFERNYRTDHMQIQVVPLPPGITSDDLKQAFFDVAGKHTDRQGKLTPIELTEIPKQTDLKQVFSAGCPFFHVELPDGTRLLHRIQRYFPLQFGREALCSRFVLDEPQRANWRECTVSHDEEVKAKEKFRSFFKEFDFTLLGDDEDD